MMKKTARRKDGHKVEYEKLKRRIKKWFDAGNEGSITDIYYACKSLNLVLTYRVLQTLMNAGTIIREPREFEESWYRKWVR